MVGSIAILKYLTYPPVRVKILGYITNEEDEYRVRALEELSPYRLGSTYELGVQHFTPLHRLSKEKK